MGEENTFLYLRSGSLQYTVIGESDQAIAETATFLWGILDGTYSSDISCTSRYIRFDTFSVDQLSNIFRARENAQIGLNVSNISPLQSKFIAQLPYPISPDGDIAFVESLLRRDLPFCTLKLWEVQESQSDTFQRLLQAKAIENVELRVGTPNQIRKLIAASVKSIRILCEADDLCEVDWSSVDIIPKELSLDLDLFDAEDHTDSLCSFFRRLAELGDFVKLEFRFWFPQVPARVVEELIHAVAANQELKELHLRRVLRNAGARLQDLFTSFGRHKTLRCLKIDTYPFELDSSFSMLEQLLKQNRFIEVIDGNGKRVTDGDFIDQLYAFNQFFRSFQGLTKESMSMLPPLICEALSRSASTDFQRSALLVANYTAALCELMQYSFVSPEIGS